MGGVSRTCARATCPRPADATLSYSYADKIVWVEPLILEAHPMVHDLCLEHAANVKVPRGWELRDLRRVDGRVHELSQDATVSGMRFGLIGA